MLQLWQPSNCPKRSNVDLGQEGPVLCSRCSSTRANEFYRSLSSAGVLSLSASISKVMLQRMAFTSPLGGWMDGWDEDGMMDRQWMNRMMDKRMEGGMDG